jgi:hypothetical protein
MVIGGSAPGGRCGPIASPGRIPGASGTCWPRISICVGGAGVISGGGLKSAGTSIVPPSVSGGGVMTSALGAPSPPHASMPNTSVIASPRAPKLAAQRKHGARFRLGSSLQGLPSGSPNIHPLPGRLNCGPLPLRSVPFSALRSPPDLLPWACFQHLHNLPAPGGTEKLLDRSLPARL